MSARESLSYADIISGRLLLQQGAVTIQGLWAALRVIQASEERFGLAEALARGPLATLAGAQELERARQKIPLVEHIEVERTFARLLFLETLVPEQVIRTLYDELHRISFQQTLEARLVQSAHLTVAQVADLRPRVNSTLHQARAEKVEALVGVAQGLGERFTPEEGQGVRAVFELAGSRPDPSAPVSRSSLRVAPEPPALAPAPDKAAVLASASDGTINPEDCPIYGYEIIEELGKGSMGVVYKASHLFSNRTVALKILPLRLAAKTQNLERFKREAMALMRIEHENVVRAYDFGGSEAYYYLALEYIDGETLEAILEREGHISEERALQITRQVALGLACAAKHGIIHRDIKPENVMLTSEGVAKICDFGIVKLKDLEEGSVTMVGTTVGTPFYISPEQARGEDTIDERSDMYSLGISLFHLTTGEVPFTGKSQGAILVRHILEEVPDPRSINPALSEGLAKIVHRMTRKHREARFESPEQLVEEIDRVLLNGSG